jgi:hypothetical protein
MIMFRGMFRAMMWQWLFSSMTRRSGGRGSWWGRGRNAPADSRPAPAPARGWSLGRLLVIVLIVCVAIYAYNRFQDRPERYDPDLPPVEEPRGGW